MGREGSGSTPLSQEDRYFHNTDSFAEEEGGGTGKVIIREESPGQSKASLKVLPFLSFLKSLSGNIWSLGGGSALQWGFPAPHPFTLPTPYCHPPLPKCRNKTLPSKSYVRRTNCWPSPGVGWGRGRPATLAQLLAPPSTAVLSRASPRLCCTFPICLRNPAVLLGLP